MVGSSRTSRFTPRAWRSAIAARVRSPGDSRPTRLATWSAFSPNFARSVRTSTCVRRGGGLDRATEGQRMVEGRPGLVDDADRDGGPERGGSRVGEGLAEEQPQQRRLAGSVGSGDADAVTGLDLSDTGPSAKSPSWAAPR